MRSPRVLLTGAACIGFAVSTVPSSAQDNSEDLETLRAEVADLKAQLAALAAKVNASEQRAPTAAPEVKWKGAPEQKSAGGWSFKPRGRILFDAATVNAPGSITNDGTGFSNEARRVRLGVSGTVPGGFGYKLEADFAGGGAELTDAYVQYADGGLKIIAGQHNNFQGLEELTSSNDTSFIERAAYTDAFDLQRKIGLSAQYKAGLLLLQGGVFTDNVSDLDSDGNDSIGFDGRIVIMPKFGEAQTHFGASYHLTNLGDGIDSRRYRQRPLVHSTDIRFINTGNIGDAKTEESYGLEAAIIAGRFHAVAESHWLTLNRRAGNLDPTFFGGSIEAGMFLTNDTRDYKDGLFKGIKVRNPVGGGGLGALQINVRYDHLDLVDAGIIGGIQDSYQASLIWTPIDYIRLLINYGKLDYDQAAITAAGSGDYDVDVFGARFQVSF
mgnify:CR=1 FL=1